MNHSKRITSKRRHRQCKHQNANHSIRQTMAKKTYRRACYVYWFVSCAIAALRCHYFLSRCLLQHSYSYLYISLFLYSPLRCYASLLPAEFINTSNSIFIRTRKKSKITILFRIHRWRINYASLNVSKNSPNSHVACTKSVCWRPCRHVSTNALIRIVSNWVRKHNSSRRRSPSD